MALVFYFQYLVVPFVFLVLSPHIPKFLFFPILWVLAYLNFLLISGNRSVKEFFKSVLGSFSLPKRKDIFVVLLRFLSLFLITVFMMSKISPDDLFGFPKRAFGFWIIVMCLYPILSVIPQGFIYRYAMFELGRDLAPKNHWLKVLFGAILFSFVHIIFKNPIALTATFIGGVMFCNTYLKSQSLLLSNIEHALYGQMIFTVGLGKYLYLVN